MGCAQISKEHSTWMQESQHTMEYNRYNTQWISLNECNNCYKFYVKVCLISEKVYTTGETMLTTYTTHFH